MTLNSKTEKLFLVSSSFEAQTPQRIKTETVYVMMATITEESVWLNVTTAT